VAGQLRATFLFRGWPDADLAELARMARLHRARCGDLLFMQGDDCGHLHVLTEGKVQLYRIQSEGREVTLHVVGGVCLVACAALFMGSIYPASARVVSPEARLIQVRGQSFLDLLARRPDLSRRMIGALAGRIGELADRLESQSADTAPTRMAKWLAELPRVPTASKNGTTVVRIPGTKRAAAAGLGMAPETFSRCLRRLEESGVIRVDGRDVAVLDPNRLIAEAGAA
jgi:CRP-like cAMP-binding protein